MDLAAAVDPILDLARPSILRNPYPSYGRMRVTSPVFWHELLGSWVLTRHADCLAVLTDSNRFASDWRRAGEDIPAPLLSVQTLDPPEHTAIRHLLLDGFRAQDRAALHDALEGQIDDLLAELARRPSFDFVGELAEPVALRFVTAFLGVPAPELDWFVPMSRTVVDGMDSRPVAGEARSRPWPPGPGWRSTRAAGSPIRPGKASSRTSPSTRRTAA